MKIYEEIGLYIVIIENIVLFYVMVESGVKDVVIGFMWLKILVILGYCINDLVKYFFLLSVKNN